jgi:osmotically-inducible protein OsmY
MERKDQRDPYREQRAETWRGNESQSQDYRGQNQSDRQQSGETDRSTSRAFEGRDWSNAESGRAGSEGGRQYEPGGGYGYGRQGYTAGQSGQGYYGARPMSEGTGAGYAGGQYARSEDQGYGRQAYTPGQYGQTTIGAQHMSDDRGMGYVARERSGQYPGQYGGRFAGRGPKNYVRSDERIREDVCRLLTEDWEVDASDVTVTVANCEVTLSGTVPSREQRRRAEDRAEQVPGVAHVQNNVRVEDRSSWSDARNEIPRDETGELISADKVEGTAVYGADRKKIGTIETVMLTKRSGRVAYAVLGFGGFLGLGADHYPLPWSLLKYDTELGGYVVSLTKDQLQNAPKYGSNDSWDWTNPETSRRIDQYYGSWLGTMY